ncbi:MAG TPA: polymer-forming cytoskeletal protein [Bryobacteraceae bacterium]|jgi:cytoskeletal protein CcmA (bactofilin family)|nr:polymer-forming cytoskeletal protein [Bryobacteraceae bacterium]
MWNNRPDEELPKSFTPPTAGATKTTTNSVQNKKETTQMMPTPTMKTDLESSQKSPAVIGAAVKVVGEIYSNEDLLIEGFVQGTVEALQQKLTVGRNGTMHARVQAREVDVQGTVQGDVEATERIDIRKDAKLVGDIKAARIVIEDGAYFNGRIEIVRPEPAATKPQIVRSTATLASPTPAVQERELMVAGAR